ncbi:MAG: Type 1 glutamine amidotransferase-like domain-containing protein, partial [Chitinophagales bacterium]
MQKTIVSFIIPLAFFYFSCYGQTGEIITSFKKEYPKGTLFIIGGGDRDSNLMQELIEVSNYKPGDIIAVVTMASGWGDSAYIWLNDEFKALGKTNKNCIKVDSITVKNPVTLDSLLMAKIIFLSGGDQSVLMKHISGTEFKKKIQKAFWNGSTIAGTSA